MKFGNRSALLSPILLAAITAFLVFASGCGEHEHGRQQSNARPNVAKQNGGIVLTLEKSAQEKAGIAVSPLKAAVHRGELHGYGSILQPDALIDIRSRYLSAISSADKAAAILDASRREYERLKKLNEDNRNISDKALQAAGAALAAHEADASASREGLQAVRQTAVAQWGGVVSGWIFRSSPEINRLVELREVLIRITLPADKLIETAPEIIGVQAPGSKVVSARFVSSAPSADPRTQGAGFLYTAPAYAFGLVPGMNVRAFVPFGPKGKGVIIPSSSVIWFQGKAWAYVQTGPEQFTRREIPVVTPGRDGYFVPEPFRPGEKVVTEGAQTLLSRESLPSKPGGGEEEDKD